MNLFGFLNVDGLFQYENESTIQSRDFRLQGFERTMFEVNRKNP